MGSRKLQGTQVASFEISAGNGTAHESPDGSSGSGSGSAVNNIVVVGGGGD